jgi:hypothetical protein
MPWVYNPHTGGVKIPISRYDSILACVDAFERSRPWYPKTQLSVRFKSQFCYLDMIEEGEKDASPLARLRYFRDEHWSMAFYTWSHERYEPCAFSKGGFEGTLEDAIIACELFLMG